MPCHVGCVSRHHDYDGDRHDDYSGDRHHEHANQDTHHTGDNRSLQLSAGVECVDALDPRQMLQAVVVNRVLGVQDGILLVSVPVVVIVPIAVMVVVAISVQDAASIVCRKAGQAAVVLYQSRAQPNAPAVPRQRWPLLACVCTAQRRRLEPPPIAAGCGCRPCRGGSWLACPWWGYPLSSSWLSPSWSWWQYPYKTRRASSAAKLAKLRLGFTKPARSLMPSYSETQVAIVSLRRHPARLEPSSECCRLWVSPVSWVLWLACSW